VFVLIITMVLPNRYRNDNTLARYYDRQLDAERFDSQRWWHICDQPARRPSPLAAGRRTCLCPASAPMTSNTAVHTPRCIRRKLARNFRLQLDDP
jgi:hypothetical protein